MNYFLNVLDVLQPQVGIDGIKQAVEIFLDVAMRNQQSKCFFGLEKLLQILQLVIEAPGTSCKIFLPGILQLSLQNVYPFVMCNMKDQPDVVIALLKLLHR